MKCPHGATIGEQGGVALQDIASCESEHDEVYLLSFYSACDCCGILMDHGTPYQRLADGRTLCGRCEVRDAARAAKESA